MTDCLGRLLLTKILTMEVQCGDPRLAEESGEWEVGVTRARMWRPACRT
jgi:hypothetical protein